MNVFERTAYSRFTEVFGHEPERVFFAPGRVNLIGEHIDYNGGFVMPCSLSIGTYAAASRNTEGVIRLISADMDGGEISVPAAELLSLTHTPGAFSRFSWAAYPLGVAAKLASEGYEIGGFEMAVCGSLPRGSGLSSSASLEVLTCSVLKELFGLALDGVTAAKLSLAAERDCAGVNCGIMDQFICAVGRENSAVLLDTGSLEYKYLPLDLGENTLLIMNTQKPRRLADSKYNERRAECGEVLALLNSAAPLPKASLCAFTPEEFGRYSAALPPVLLKRARHAVTENARTLMAADALVSGDIELFGKLLTASHESLRNDYEVTGQELDAIVDAALSAPGVLGARMTGAGFGGCAIAIANKRTASEAAALIADAYRTKIGYDCGVIAAQIASAPFCE